MQEKLIIFFPIILAYLIGAIPTSIWTGRIFYKIDIREHGSGNAGATNVMRVLGVKTGIPVLLFDIFKGWAAVRTIYFFKIYEPETVMHINMQILLGIAAIIGHIYPVYEGFRGGKGVATVFGVLLALHPLATLCAAGIFLVTLFVSKYVSISSIVAGLSMPFWVIFIFKSPYKTLQLFSLLIAVLLIITHLKNIRKLLKGEEKKAGFLFKNK